MRWFASIATSRRAVLAGTLAAGSLTAFYAAVVALASGPSHLVEQIGIDWPWIIAIVAGFGIQVMLLVTLRDLRRARAAAAVAGTGTGASLVGMLACCAHHVAEIAPIVGVNVAATFLASQRVPFMAAGVAVNAVAVVVTLRRLRAILTEAADAQEHARCAA